jgi:hypothetical protein
VWDRAYLSWGCRRGGVLPEAEETAPPRKSRLFELCSELLGLELQSVGALAFGVGPLLLSLQTLP